MCSQIEFSPIVGDIQKQYVGYRTAGKSRNDAIAAIKENYAEELQDEDDRIAVMIGLVFSLCKKKELTKEIAVETFCMIRHAHKMMAFNHVESSYLLKVERLLGDESMYGGEAAYRRRVSYVPHWEVGDTFSHKLIHPKAEALGICGWSILLYKVGECEDELQQLRQLMYVSLCPPGKEPISGSQLQSLGFLRMMRHGEKWDYLAQIMIKSKRDELSYGLFKIGNFQDVVFPADRTDENPLVAMPLFGCKRGDLYPDYEDQICRLYKKFGGIL